jgi:hypothetical protein
MRSWTRETRSRMKLVVRTGSRLRLDELLATVGAKVSAVPRRDAVVIECESNERKEERERERERVRAESASETGSWRRIKRICLSLVSDRVRKRVRGRKGTRRS